MSHRPRNETELRQLITSTPVEGSPEAMRKAFAHIAGLHDTSGAEEIVRGNVRCLAIGEGPELIWFHGGGYVFGAPETHLALARELSEYGLRVILPAYRLAPEYHWPAPLDDALAIAKETREITGVLNLGGDSAGGHLAICVALRQQADSLALVAPNTDRSGKSSTRQRTTDIMNDDSADAALASMVMPGVGPTHPDASPLLGDLSKLPALHLEVAATEVLLDDSLLLARQAALAGVETTLIVTPGLFHMFPLWPDCLPEGAEALQRIASFVLAKNEGSEAG